MTAVSALTPGVTFALRCTGRIADLLDSNRSALLGRSTSADRSIRDATTAIIDSVRRDGDAALVALAQQFDGAMLTALEVPRDECARALDQLPAELRQSLERAARNIAAVHAAHMPASILCEPEPGISIERRVEPLDRVGVYAPGGRAAYPSSVLMSAVPARAAGVRELILCSPPGPSGRPSTLVLAAAALADVDRVFAVGGAGAIAAMAFGTTSVPRVDRIVGPGNAYVAEAKLQVCGFVGIDSPAGPSELCVIADSSSHPDRVAGEMLAQAEHDPGACVVAICTSVTVADSIVDALATLIVDHPRRDIAAAALTQRSAVLVAADRDEAIGFANAFAAEHLLLAVDSPDAWLPALRSAGTIFVGECSSVAFGDYMTGANHVLPTGGLARSYSGLSTLDFMRWTTIQTVSPIAARALSADVARFAEAEGLPGHALAARRAGELT